MEISARSAGGFAGAGRAILLVAAASAVVAVGATGVGLIGSPVALDEGSMLRVRIAGGVAVAVGLAVFLLQRRRLSTPGDPDPVSIRASLLSAANIMGLMVLFALLTMPRIADDRSSGAPAISGAPTTTTEGATPTPPRPSSAGSGAGTQGAVLLPNPAEPAAPGTPPAEVARPESGFDRSVLRWLGRALLVILFLAVVAMGAWALVGRRVTRLWQEASDELPVAPEDADAGLQASLDELVRDAGNPRAQITAAYRRLLRALAEVGVPRQTYEAPHEHLHRALGPLGVPPAPLLRLTELFVAAQFSERPVTDQHRAVAAEALEDSLASLRAAGHPLVTDGSGPLAARA